MASYYQPPRTIDRLSPGDYQDLLLTPEEDEDDNKSQEDSGPDMDSLIDRMLTLTPQSSQPSNLPDLDSDTCKSPAFFVLLF